MKAIVLGDVHFGGGLSLGKIDPRLKINTRIIDYSNTFDYVLDYAVAHEIKHLILTGDIFERRHPSVSDMALFASKIRKAQEANIHVHIVVGNHDLVYEQQAVNIDYLKNLKLDNVYIYPNLQSVQCYDNMGDAINFIFLPFRGRKMLRASSNEEAVSKLLDLLDYEIKSMDSNTPRVLVGHLMLQGTRLGDSMAENYVGDIALPLSAFNGLDAVIMGHIHTHHVIKSNPLIAYIGSMEKNNFADVGEDKYFLVMTSKNNHITFQFKKLPVRDLYDVMIDATDAENDEDIAKSVEEYFTAFSKSNDLFGSIVRIQLTVNQNDFSTKNIKKVLNKFQIHNCTGIHLKRLYSRQLRKSSITEQSDPLAAFSDYLSLLDDKELIKNMREYGYSIIKERSG